MIPVGKSRDFFSLKIDIAYYQVEFDLLIFHMMKVIYFDKFKGAHQTLFLADKLIKNI